MDTILSLQDVHVQDIVSYKRIEIPRYQITFVCGESGSGKSTLLKLFNATVSPTAGSLLYDNQSIEEMDTVTLRSQVMLVSQSVFLFDGTVEENFDQYYAYRDMPAPSRELREKYLAICCADFDSSALCQHMSGGERQRIFTSICLSFLPKILMLDEPTSALDSETARRFFLNIKGFCTENQITVITVSHDRVLADHFADHIINLEKRKIQ